ncbi:hypothetical protein [Roseateles sp.]|uniref:hypothetical protein n=1 Tax=Roseateles sp. TaxID=1971397 RepID=UPI0039382187
MNELSELTAGALRAERTRDGELTGDWFCELADDVEVVVSGEGQAPARDSVELANRVLPHRAYLLSRAVQLLEEFMRDKGAWQLVTIDLARKARQQECDFVLSLVFEAEHDPQDYGYTYFDVCFVRYDNAPKSDLHGRPVKFVVGFH